MSFLRRHLPGLLLLWLLASPSFAAKEWFDHYLDGVNAAKKEQWSTVVQKMNEALAKKPNEEEKARTYGVQFLKYRPYYYRGIAQLNLGNYQEAVRDLERTRGIGDVNLGSIESLQAKAQRLAQEQNTTTAVADVKPPVIPTTTTSTSVADTKPPVTPTDRAIVAERRRAESLLADARSKQKEAQRKNAARHASAEWERGRSLLNEATSGQATAESAAEWTRVATAADQAYRSFTAAAAKAEDATGEIPTEVADAVLADTRAQLRNGLEAYFDGRFADSARALEKLARSSGSNYPMVHAFLGAAYYYDYYLNRSANADLLDKAARSFRRAKQLKPNLQLSSKYFSPRVQRYYKSLQ